LHLIQRTLLYRLCISIVPSYLLHLPLARKRLPREDFITNQQRPFRPCLPLDDLGLVLCHPALQPRGIRLHDRQPTLGSGQLAVRRVPRRTCTGGCDQHDRHVYAERDAEAVQHRSHGYVTNLSCIWCHTLFLLELMETLFLHGSTAQET
jgi:hypothetical protein